MAVSKWDEFKPEVIRLIQEGMEFSELRKEFPQIPKGTLHGWFKSFSSHSPEPYPNRSSRSTSPPRYASDDRSKLRSVDPDNDNPLKAKLRDIESAYWDIVNDPDGKGVAVQALNGLVKCLQLMADITPVEEEDSDLNITVDRRVIDADT